MTSSLYYREFSGRIFVIQVESEAVENTAIAYAILREVRELISRGIRVVLVFGKGSRFEEELRTRFGAHLQHETNRLVVPEKALSRLQEERRRVTRQLSELCRAEKIPHEVLADSVVTAERRIGHGSTGMVTSIDLEAIRAVVGASRLAIVGFGGRDVHGKFLHVPSVSLSADLAVGLQAQKLLLLMQRDGIRVPGRKGEMQQLSFADFEELLCLLQKRNGQGDCVLSGPVLPKVHGALRAVAGGVEQVHIVSYARLLDEILTRTGVGTMIERHQLHHVDYAGANDLDAIEQLHTEAQRYRTPKGTPLVKPRTREELAALVSQTLLLKHRQYVIGMMHATDVPNTDHSLLIGSFVIAENHQDSQHGQLLLTEALSRFREMGYREAVAVTASDRAKRLFERSGGRGGVERPWQRRMFDAALARYHADERDNVELFCFDLQNDPAG